MTTPEGRIATTVHDAIGRVTEVHVPGSLPTFLEYASQGRLYQITQGTRVRMHTYGADRMLASITVPCTNDVCGGM